MYENIKYEVSEGIGYVTINRPKALNALNMDVLTDLYAASVSYTHLTLPTT